MEAINGAAMGDKWSLTRPAAGRTAAAAVWAYKYSYQELEEGQSYTPNAVVTISLDF